MQQQARYLLVRGVEGRLVANPHTEPTARRFLGKMPNGVYWHEGPIDPDTNKPRWPAAKVAEEVVLDHPAIRKAADSKRGDIVIVRDTVAASLDEARKKLVTPAEKPRAEK